MIDTLVSGEPRRVQSEQGRSAWPSRGPVCLSPPTPAGIGRRPEEHGDPQDNNLSFLSSLGPGAHPLCDLSQQINLSGPIF